VQEKRKQRRRQTDREKKFLFTLVNEKTFHHMQVEHTLLFQAI
jgi:hypothetical protein